MILIFLTFLLFAAFVVVLIIALANGRKDLFPYVIGLFVATAVLGGLSVSTVVGRAVTAMSNVEPREGMEMYEQTFSTGALECVKVINSQDRKDFLRDCCIWMQFETCPAEINRILASDTNELMKADMIRLDMEKLKAWLPETSNKPGWWKPETLGDSAFLINFSFPVPGIEKRVFLSADTTKAFYYEKMDTVFKTDSTDN